MLEKVIRANSACCLWKFTCWCVDRYQAQHHALCRGHKVSAAAVMTMLLLFVVVVVVLVVVVMVMVAVLLLLLLLVLCR